MPHGSDTQRNENTRLRRVIREGFELAGGAAGASLGVVSGEPALAPVLGAAGVAAGNTLRYVGNEFVERILGPRERKRVGAVISIIAKDIHSRTSRGERVRTDGFFDRNDGRQSDAEEVAESVFLKCQREPEEKKIEYMGHFYSNVVFHPEISAHAAHQLIKHAEQLTYRQFCLLKIAKFDNYRAGLQENDYRGRESFSLDLQQILYEALDLYTRGFVNFGGEVAFGPTDINPRKMQAQGLGVHLAILLNVESIPDEDLSPIIEQLR